MTLKSSKSGTRHGAEEAVALREKLVLQLLDTLLTMQLFAPAVPSSGHFQHSFERSFQALFALLSFKLYSVGRGVATYLLQEGLPLDLILLRGRWRSLAVARIYLEDGLAQLPRCHNCASPPLTCRDCSMYLNNAPRQPWKGPVLVKFDRAWGTEEFQ